MFNLSRLKDVTRFYDDSFRNEVYLITDDVPIKCNGILLAARSRKIEDIIKDTENIPANEHSDNLPALYDCLDLIYGSNVAIGRNNYKTIFKFGKTFGISEMVKGVSNWIASDYSMFWEIYHDLTKLGQDINSLFHDATSKFIKKNRTKVLTDALEICQFADANTIKYITELFADNSNLSVDDMLNFLKDVLVSSSVIIYSLNGKSTVISGMISHIDTSMIRIDYDQWFLTTSSLYTDTLTALTNVCSDVELQRTIFSLQGDIHSLSMFFYKPSLRNLTRRVLDHYGINRGSPRISKMEELCRSQFISSPIHFLFGEYALMCSYRDVECRCCNRGSLGIIKPVTGFSASTLFGSFISNMPSTSCKSSMLCTVGSSETGMRVRMAGSSSESDMFNITSMPSMPSMPGMPSMPSMSSMFKTIRFSLKEHDQSCKDHLKKWCDNILKDKRYEDDTYTKHATKSEMKLGLKTSKHKTDIKKKLGLKNSGLKTDIKRMLTLITSTEERYLYYYFKSVPTLKQYVQDNTLPELKGYIRKGDGTPFFLPVEALHCTHNMLKYKEETRKFSYNPDAVPSYGKSGHWYLVGVLEGDGQSSYSYDRKFDHIFISVIANTKREILKLLEDCIGAYLYFIPPCNCNPIKERSKRYFTI